MMFRQQSFKVLKILFDSLVRGFVELGCTALGVQRKRGELYVYGLCHG